MNVVKESRAAWQKENVALYLVGGRNWRQSQVKELSLDMAPQSGAAADRRAEVVNSGGDARSSGDSRQRFSSLRCCLSSLRRKRAGIGDVREPM